MYIDAGYLLAAAATRVTASPLRSEVTVDRAALIAQLIRQVEAASGRPLLRVNWYDGAVAPGRFPDQTQEAINRLPRVKLRLGNLSGYGEQEGLDARLGLDLVTHARNQVADLMYLVSGDDRLAEAVEEAQGYGAQIVVLVVPDAGDVYGVGRRLPRSAARVEMIHPATIDSSVRPISIGVPDPEQAPATPLTTEPPPSAMATPAALARPKPTWAYTPPVNKLGDPSVCSGDQSAGSQIWSPDLIDEVCLSVLAGWLSRVSSIERSTLLQQKPFVPSEIDRALLTELSDRTKDYDLEPEARLILRRRFWDLAEQALS